MTYWCFIVCNLITNTRRTWRCNRVRSALDSYCSIGISTPTVSVTNTTTVTSCSGQGHTISKVTTTSKIKMTTTSILVTSESTITPIMPYTYTSGESWSSFSKSNGIQTKDVAFATLFGLIVVLLVVVTIGWICTCWIMKKKIVKKRWKHSMHLALVHSQCTCMSFKCLG